jgi:glycine betaine/proline transport system substrate-binding protein
MIVLRLLLVFGFAFLGATGALAQGAVRPSDLPDCGDRPITIAQMQWPSAAILAHIHAQVLSQDFGCAVQVVSGDLGATASSIATTGSPDVAPEMWLGRVASVWNPAVSGQKVRPAAPTYSGGPLEAWFVPSYVETNNPGLSTAAGLMDFWRVFAPPGGERATLLSCPADWACAVIDRNLVRAFGLDKRFDIVTPGTRFDLDQAIASAISKHKPLLFYYWQPNALVSQLDLKPLDMGAFDAKAMGCLGDNGCAEPKPSAFVPEQVVIAVAERIFAEVPAVADYFQRATMPLSEMNALLDWQSQNDAAPEDVARHFVGTRAEIWRKWVGE